MKIAFLGGGALRLLGAVDDILKQPDVFASPHLTFMDVAPDRAETVAKLASKMPSARDCPPVTEVTGDLDEALDGADFVYCCIRVGGVRAMETDKRIGARYGFHGHDDFGPSAVMLTARTVPVMLNISARMERLCPGAWLLIFTNPITTLVDAVSRYSKVRAVGICQGVTNLAYDMDHLFGIGVPNEELVFRGGGLNHFSWVTRDSTYKGRPIMEMVRRHFDDLPHRQGAEKCGWRRAAPLVDLYDAMFLNNGHQHHFFYHDELAAELAARFAGPEVLRSDKQDRQFEDAAALARQETIDNYWQQAPLRNCATGPVGQIGVQFMQAAATDSGAELCVTTPNHGHIAGITQGAPVEAPVRVRADRLEPVPIDPVPDSLKGLCNAIAHHQRTTVDAAVKADRKALMEAILCEPTIRSYEKAAPMFDELWEAHVRWTQADRKGNTRCRHSVE